MSTPPVLEGVLAGIREGVVILDATWRYTYVNPAATQLLGHDADALLGRVAWEVFPAVGTLAHAELLRVRAEGAPREFEAPHPPTGRVYQNRAYPAGEGVAVLFYDVTERRETERRLRASEAQFRHLAELIPSIVWTADPEGTITWVNEEWHRYTGLSPRSDLAGWFERSLHPEDRERCLSGWSEALRSAGAYECEARLRRRDAMYRWFVTRAAASRDEEGRVVAWFGVSTDIHEQKLLEERLREATRYRDQLLAVVSHDLRGQLGIVSLTASALGRASGVEEPARQKQRILRATARMTALVNDLLDSAAIEAGQLRVQPTRVALGPLLDEVLEPARTAALERRIGLEVRHAPGALHVHCDRSRIGQVLGNLLGNAIKFSPPGSRVTLAAEPAGDRVRLSVADQGPGITLRERERIFQRFARASDGAVGHGLGLFIAQGIATAHGTRVELESAPDRGSVFSIDLPLARASEAR